MRLERQTNFETNLEPRWSREPVWAPKAGEGEHRNLWNWLHFQSEPHRKASHPTSSRFASRTTYRTRSHLNFIKNIKIYRILLELTGQLIGIFRKAIGLLELPKKLMNFLFWPARTASSSLEQSSQFFVAGRTLTFFQSAISSELLTRFLIRIWTFF